MKTNETGRSMIEMLGVLAIIGGLSVGGIAGYSKAMNVYRVNKSVDQLMQIVASTRSLFAGHKLYTSLTKSNKPNMDLIKKAHLVPDDMINGNTIENVYGGEVLLNKANKGSRTDKAFSVYFAMIPQSSCIELATKEWGQGKTSGLYSISINGTVVHQADATDDKKNPVGIAKAATNCNSATDNKILWVFY